MAGRVDDAHVVAAEAGGHRPEEPPVGRDGPAGGEVAESHLRPLWGELATVEQEARGGIGSVGRRLRRAGEEPRKRRDEYNHEG